MDLNEHEGRAFFIKHGIPVPRGFLVKKASKQENSKQIETVLSAFLHKEADIRKFALKAQLLSGKRGKGGGIIFTDKKHFVKDVKKLRDKTVNGEKVKEILAVEALAVAKEYYLAVTVDRNARLPVIIFSDRGGVDIEETAETDPTKIIRITAADTKSFPEKEMRKIAERFFGNEDTGIQSAKKGLNKLARKGSKDAVWTPAAGFVEIARNLFNLFSEEDCLLAEINPLILTKNGILYAADAKITIDDSSIYRHPKNAGFIKRGHSTLESAAAEFGLSYVELDGNLAIIGNGAGLVMASLDAVKRFGANPANFCDIGGGASEMMVKKAMEIVLQKKSVEAIFINIFGGITRCDEVARGIVRFIKTRSKKIPPMVVRLVGTNENEGVKILLKAGIKAFTGFNEAARAAGGLV